ncbi:MAG: tyrosine-type recombinase/integrase, partial [Bacteroidota bacterium]
MIQQNPKEENNIPFFSSFVKSYLDTKRIDLRKGTIELVEYSVEQFLKRLPDKIITEYTVEDIEQFKQKGLQDKLSPTTVNIYFRNIRTLFRYAFKKNLIKHDIGETVKQIKTPEKNPKFMNKEELNQLLMAIKRNKPMHDLFLVCSLTGMRCSEAINLQWDAVDFANRVINVKNTETFTTKTGKERTIPMHEKVVEVLKGRYNPERKYVFNKPGNTVPYSRNYIAHKFKIAVRKAKLPEYL